jgi:hypothetical protein
MHVEVTDVLQHGAGAERIVTIYDINIAMRLVVGIAT